MFELYHPPLPGQIMRFTAWRVQNDYFRWCGQVQARTKNRLIFSHESALGLMGVGFLDTAAVKPDRVYEGHSSEGRAFKNRISGNRASKHRVSENRLSDLRTYEDHIPEPDRARRFQRSCGFPAPACSGPARSDASESARSSLSSLVPKPVTADDLGGGVPLFFAGSGFLPASFHLFPRGSRCFG